MINESPGTYGCRWLSSDHILRFANRDDFYTVTTNCELWLVNFVQFLLHNNKLSIVLFKVHGLFSGQCLHISVRNLVC